MKIVLVVAIISFLVSLWVRNNKGNAKAQPNNIVSSKLALKSNVSIKPEEFVSKLDSLGYFKYADDKNIELLKKDNLSSFKKDGTWGRLWDDETLIPLDYRNYGSDGETLFEQGGFDAILKDMKPTFDKIGFTLSVDEQFEEWDSENEWLNHRITLNGTEYVIFKNFKGYGWGEAAQRFAEIINAEFEKQGIDERVYLINGGNDGSLIVLDSQLYNYFYEVFTEPQWKPLEVKEWAKVMRIAPMNLD